jgi:hypothetical protein
MPDHSTPPTPEELAERIRRRKLVARLYLRGLTEPAIAEELDVSEGTVDRDITHLGEQWRKESDREPRFRYERELARTEALEYEIWQAWEASSNPTHKVAVVRDAEGREKTTTTMTECKRDPRYIGFLIKCVPLRRSAAEKVEASAEQPYGMGRPTDEQVQKEMDTLVPILEKINAHVRDLKAQGGPFPPGYDPDTDGMSPPPNRPPDPPSPDHYPCAPLPGRDGPNGPAGDPPTAPRETAAAPPASDPPGWAGSRTADPGGNPARDPGQGSQPGFQPGVSPLRRIQLPPNTIILGHPNAPYGLSPSGIPWPAPPGTPGGWDPRHPDIQPNPHPPRTEPTP